MPELSGAEHIRDRSERARAVVTAKIQNDAPLDFGAKTLDITAFVL